jgi:hypothetical protein
MSAPEVILSVGGVLKAAAGRGADDDYRRGQMLSAYSICRHLAAEEAARPRLRSWFEAELEPILARRGEAGAEGADLGTRLCVLMAELRASGDSDSEREAAVLRAALRGLCDREIEALAAAE